jgi:hypothetical protein
MSRLRFAEIEAHVRLTFEVSGYERTSSSPDVVSIAFECAERRSSGTAGLNGH